MINNRRSVACLLSAWQAICGNTDMAQLETNKTKRSDETMRTLKFVLIIIVVFAGFKPALAQTIPAETLKSVVSVLPVWPTQPQGGTGARAGTAPEGSGVVITKDGMIATAWHVIAPAWRIDVRLHDGRIVPAELIGKDEASDIALLKTDAELVPFKLADEPTISSSVCAIGNAYGLDLSVTCGVVSAVRVGHAGFNTVEHFIQNDAASNPGSSGGALVNDAGELVGMLSAIFASQADTNVGVNFAVSARLLDRVVTALQQDGAVEYVQAGWQVTRLRPAQAAEFSGALIRSVSHDGVAETSGLLAGDIVTRINGRLIRRPQDVPSEMALVRNGTEAKVQIIHQGRQINALLSFEQEEQDNAPTESTKQVPIARPTDPDCPHPAAVCLTRQAVFPIESFDPIASAVRIGPDLVVTNRHVIGDRKTANILTPTGPVKGDVIASSYRGDLAVLRVSGLPADGLILKPADGQTDDYDKGTHFAVGADAARQQVRVFDAGKTILPPANGAPFGRHHVTSRMQPGVSGGALVNAQGQLAGIAVGGGEGRYEALPLPQVNKLLAGVDADDAPAVQQTLGRAFVRCVAAVDAARDTPRGQAHDTSLVEALTDYCLTSENPGEMVNAGRLLGIGRATNEAIKFHEAVVTRVPNSINARLSLLVSLQLGGRFKEMLPHARWVMDILDNDPQALRFAIQSGVWGEDKALAERAYAKLLEADPRQAQAARRFIDNAPPAPPRR